MTQVYVHPGVEDYFVEYDFDAVRRSPADGSGADLRRQVMADYVAEKCILLRNVRIDYDRAFIAGLDFPATWFFKKFNSSAVETEAPRETLRQALFGRDKGRFRKFEREVRTVNAGLRAVLGELLVHHRVTSDDVVWRHTETRVEKLHLDVDKGSAGFESVRLYLNMDEIPRLWRTSHPLRRLLDACYAELDLAGMADQPLEDLLGLLTRRLFGNWASRGREQIPQHTVLFEPQDVWLCDGRTVPHQVMYGRRAVSTFSKLDAAALPAWHPSLASKVAAVHAAHRNGTAPAGSPEALGGYVLPFGPGGPPLPPGAAAVDLKADWERFYRDSIQQKLVRL